jgi:predicted ATPase
MKSIQIRNLRSLNSTGNIEIEPLTIVVGKNSSGKSTFIRAFPLMKQTVESAASGAVLWYGNTVDFGEFRTAISRNSGRTGTIEFAFSFATAIAFRRRFFLPEDDDYIDYYSNYVSQRIDVDLQLKLNYAEAKIGQNSLIGLEIDAFDHKIKIRLDKMGDIGSLVVNGQEFVDKESAFRKSAHSSVLPQIDFYKVKRSSEGKREVSLSSPSRRRQLVEAIGRHLRSDATERYKLRISRHINLTDKNSMIENFRDSEKFGVPISRKAQNWSENSDEFLEIVNLYIVSNLNDLILGANSYLETYFKGVKYIAPLRATADRYYRIQNLAVREIDADGKNLPMILKSFTKKELETYNKWLSESFGFIVELHNGDGHVSLRIKENNSEDLDNISDMGFGYSQVLPIITQMWLIQNDGSKPSSLHSRLRERIITLVIEQPELHLHPAMQASFADALAKILNNQSKDDKRIRFIIETHSDTIINRISQLIKRNILDEKDVKIYIFDKEVDGSTTVTQSGYDESGFIINWPIGFFTPPKVNTEHSPSPTGVLQENNVDMDR